MFGYYGNILARQTVNKAAFTGIAAAVNANMWFGLSSSSDHSEKICCKISKYLTRIAT
jgi:hypothetical protein